MHCFIFASFWKLLETVEDIRIRIYGCLCTPRKRKEEAEESCRCREITILAAWWWFLISHLKHTHTTCYCDLCPLSLIHPLTHAPAAAYLKTIKWRPLLEIVYNAYFVPLRLLSCAFLVSVLYHFLFSLNLSFFFLTKLSAFHWTHWARLILSEQEKGKHFSLKKGCDKNVTLNLKIHMNSLCSTLI